jgi:hypothetical protein
MSAINGLGLLMIVLPIIMGGAIGLRDNVQIACWITGMLSVVAAYFVGAGVMLVMS